MLTRPIPSTGEQLPVIGLGTWQLGADWGDVTESDARAVLEASAEAGVTFYDTADVYGDGRSERLLCRLRRERKEPFVVATKVGRRQPKHLAEQGNQRRKIERRGTEDRNYA